MKAPRKPDFNKARQTFENFNKYGLESGGPQFSEYSPAYALTNEDLRIATKFQNLDNARVLAAAGSGDAPIFYSLAGAKDVHAFDISLCSKAIMDIKTAAIPVLSHFQYGKLINDVYGAEHVSAVQNFSEIQASLPLDTRELISETDGHKIFNNGLSPSKYKKHLPTEEEYAAMKKLISKPFKFIWTDICELHEHLEFKYDVMNLSNIFEYIDDVAKKTEILENLRPYLSSRGIILVHTTWFFRDFELKNYKQVQENIKNWASLGILNSRGQQSMVLHSPEPDSR
ncbi:MAG: DUF3419 family protein [Rickettsiales bacterium]|jgi:hypothetical protein|nr:DUF3419 family protein [Rickettsiales bacterium]